MTTDSINVPDDQIISSMDVAIAVQHPRISDLVFHLISPDGTRELLMENRGGTDPNGAGGVATVTTNNALASDFDTVAAGDYTAGQTVGGWNVAGNQVSVQTDPANAYPGNSNLLALANGTLSTTLATVPGATYTLTFAYRGPGIVGMVARGEQYPLDSAADGNDGTCERHRRLCESAKLGRPLTLMVPTLRCCGCPTAPIPRSSESPSPLKDGFIRS